MSDDAFRSRPRRCRRRSIELILVAVLLGACGSDSTTDDALSTDELEMVLLSPDDLVGDWTATGSGTSPVEPSRLEELCGNGQQLQLLDATTVTAAAFVRAPADIGATGGASIVEELSVVTLDEAERFMADADTVVAGCVGEPWATPEGDDVVIESRALPTVGDEAIGYRMVVQPPVGGSTVLVDIAWVRVGPVVMRLIAEGAADDGSSTSSVDFDAVVRRAVDVLAQAGS